jgi:cytochrome c556
MNARHPRLALLLVLVLPPTLAPAPPARAQKPDALRPFMRQKLELSQGLLEGLTREDYALLRRNAEALRKLSEDAQWRVSPNVNYLRLSNDFQARTEAIAAEAADRDLDGATLAYVEMTLNCVKCHQLVREKKLVRTGFDRGSLPAGN